MQPRSNPTDWINALEIVRIRLGFARVVPNCEAFAADFFARLFERAPATRSLFPDDPSAARVKLKQMLVMLMTALNRPQELRPVLVDLGNRCHACGIDNPTPACQALIETLAAHLGERFTTNDRTAWNALQERITGIVTLSTMQEAAAA